METWAIFKDRNGCLLCRQPNLFLDIWEKHIPARPEVRRFGKSILPEREAVVQQKIVFNPKRYSRKRYVESSFAPAPEGYVFNPNRRYMENNLWGLVDVIGFVSGAQLGRQLEELFGKLLPEGYDNKGLCRDENVLPHPATDNIMKYVMAIVEDNARLYNE